MNAVDGCGVSLFGVMYHYSDCMQNVIAPGGKVTRMERYDDGC